LAQSRGSSNGVDLLDVVSSWEAFEVINKGNVRMVIGSRQKAGNWELIVVAEFWSHLITHPGAELLGSESAICSAMSWKSLDTVVFRLLYALDAQLACKEFQDIKKERQAAPRTGS